MSEVWTTSAIVSPADASCMTFWKIRWDPSRASSQVIPIWCLLKASQTFWASDSPRDEYQTTLPSFLAASITAGSAASAAPQSPRARISPARVAQDLSCVIIRLLSCPCVPSSRAPESPDDRGDIRCAVDGE